MIEKIGGSIVEENKLNVSDKTPIKNKSSIDKKN